VSSSHPCHPPAGRTRTTVRPAPLRRAEDAIDVLLLAASQPYRPEAIALVLDHAHRGLACVVVDGATDATLSEVATALLLSAEARSGVGAFVLATTAPPGGWPADGHELERHEMQWFDLREQFETPGYDLLDWFVLVDGLAVSMAELTDSHARWLER